MTAPANLILLRGLIPELPMRAGVPIRDDAPLAEALAALELDTEVPDEPWAAVAEALVWAYRMDLAAVREARPD